MLRLARKPIDQEDVLDVLVEADQEVKRILGGRLFSWPLSGFPQAKDQMAQFLGVDSTLIDEFFTKKSFLVLLKPRMYACYRSSLIQAVRSLETAHSEFDAFLLGQLKELNTDLPIDDALLDSKQQFDAVKGAVNALIRIKNNNSTEFRRCIALFAEAVQPAMPPEKTSLTAAQMKALLDTLSQSGQDQVAEPLAILCKILKQIPDYSAVQLSRALKDVTELTQSRTLLGP